MPYNPWWYHNVLPGGYGLPTMLAFLQGITRRIKEQVEGHPTIIGWLSLGKMNACRFRFFGGILINNMLLLIHILN
jgi:succinate dehydrogenase/fumarate reductase flavoprotein subunit